MSKMPQVVLHDGLYCCNSMILRLFFALVRFIRLSKGIGGEERTKILNTGVNRLLSVR